MLQLWKIFGNCYDCSSQNTFCCPSNLRWVSPSLYCWRLPLRVWWLCNHSEQWQNSCASSLVCKLLPHKRIKNWFKFIIGKRSEPTSLVSMREFSIMWWLLGTAHTVIFYVILKTHKTRMKYWTARATFLFFYHCVYENQKSKRKKNENRKIIHMRKDKRKS